jgi:flagellar hook protein FlgE
MMRSLFSGVSGLKVHQTKMDVIGNNISNINTVGFKASSVTFTDVFYQTAQNATGPNQAIGTTGRNAMQIGLGSSVATISTSITKSGAAQRTDNPFDLMIEGDSFFIVNKGGANYFTKAGTFDIDSQGVLCTPYGAAVMGWQVDPNDITKTVAETVTPLKILTPENLYAEPEATTNVYISGNIDSKDTQLTSETGVRTSFTFFDKRGHEYRAEMVVKQLPEATNLYSVAIRDIKDESGQSIFLIKNVDPVSGEITYESSGYTTFSFGGEDYSVDVDTETGTVMIDTSQAPTLTFNGSTGAFVSVGEEEGAKSIALSIVGDPNPFSPIDVDFSSITMYSTSGNSSLEAEKGSLEGLGTGRKVGDMTGISIDPSGKIFGKYDNGITRLLGQIAVASFANPAGLEAVGNSMFATTLNSGDFDGIGHDPSKGDGSIITGTVEMSNVDLSQQFTEMITTQRGFQANSRIITTSDTLLEELINLKR